MTSMAELLAGRAPAVPEVRNAVTAELAALLGFTGVAPAPPEAAWAFLPGGRGAADVAAASHPGATPYAGGTPTW